MARIADSRVRQFWDRNHAVSGALMEIAKRQPALQPVCCVQRGFYWDDAILYPRGSHWSDAVPVAFWNGPVVNALPSLQKLLDEQR